MALFAWTAIDAHGRRQRGTLAAPHDGALEQRLARMQLELISVRDVSWRQGLAVLGQGVSRRELIIFCFHLEQLVRAGVPLVDGLADLRDSAGTHAFRSMVGSLVEDIEAGLQLSAALARHPRIFDRVFVNLVSAGEISGRLPSVLAKLGEMLRWQDELAAQGRKIILYPAFVAVIVTGVVVFLMVNVVPQLLGFISSLGQQLPLHTRMLVAVSDFIVARGWLLAVVPPLTLLGIRIWAARDPDMRYRVDDWKLRLWVTGPILRAIILARLSHFFALLYDAGIPVVEALKVAQGVMGNAVMAADIGRVHALILEGQGVAASFEKVGLFSPLVLRMLRAGESSGTLDSALQTISYFYGRDVQDAIARIQSLIEPVLTLVLGTVLAWVMLAVLGPIYELIGQIKL